MSGRDPNRPAGASGPAGTVAVWDRLVRIGHWSLVIAFAVAYLTEDEALEVHEWAGYAVAGYVVVRIVWGFVGTEHARFADFLYSPIQGLSYLLDLARARARRYIGHSPAGAMMAFALLFMLAGTVVSGMTELALSHGEGPFAWFLAQQTAPTVAVDGSVVASEGRSESVWEEVHELFANLTLILIVLHVAGVAVASLAHKENLVRAMVTGFKRSGGEPH